MNFKKITAFATAAMIAAGVCTGVPTGTENNSPFAITASAVTSGLVTGKDEDGDMVIKGYAGKSGDVEITGSLGAIAIGKKAFYNNQYITKATISSDIIGIDSYAFYGCPNLKEVVIEGDISINPYAFAYCPNLETVTIKGSVSGSINDMAFANCSSLKTVKISKNTKSFDIGAGAFGGCYSLTDINIPDKCGAIYGGAFLNCFSLTKLTIPANTKIKNFADGNSYEKENGLQFGMYSMYDSYKEERSGNAVRKTLGKEILGVSDGKTKGYSTTYEAKSGYILNDSNGNLTGIAINYYEYTPKAITLTVTKGSDAEKWAKLYNVKYTYANGSSSSSSSSKLAAPTGFKASKSQTKITLSWDAVEGADGYVVYMYNEKTGKYESYKSVKNAKCTISGLKKNTKYKFKVAALVKKDGKYVVQTSSKAVSATTKK